MIKIGITGSLASGKSTVAKLISRNKYPIFNADNVVKTLYKKKIFTKKIQKKFHFKKPILYKFRKSQPCKRNS